MAALPRLAPTQQARRAVPKRGLSYLPLIVLLRSIQPALQRSLRLRFDLQEDYAGTHIRLRINDFGLGGEERIPGGDPHEHQRSLGERIHHIQIATM